MDWSTRIGKSEFGAEPGEAIFTQPFRGLSPDAAAINGPSITIISAAQDDRSRALLSAMIIENYLDILLSRWIPGYKKLVANRDFTLSLKISLLEGFQLIPMQIVKAADVVRLIRNDFAHNLEISNFEELSGNRVNQLKELHRKIFGNKDGLSDHNYFEEITQVSTVGLQLYIVNTQLLRKKLEDANFIEDTLSAMMVFHESDLQLVVQQTALTTFTLGASSVNIYPDGFTDVQTYSTEIPIPDSTSLPD